MYQVSGVLRRAHLTRDTWHLTPAQKTKNLFSFREEAGNSNRSSHFFPSLLLELELAPGHWIRSNRLPWLHRASPSATLNETVISTDADTLISSIVYVNEFLEFCQVMTLRHCAC